MGIPRKDIQATHRKRRQRGIRMLQIPAGYDLLDHLQSQGYLPPGTALDWPTLPKADVEDALRRYLDDRASAG